MKNKIYSSTKREGLFLIQLACVFALVLFAFGASAQTADKTIKGTVKSAEDNSLLPGVNVYLKGNTAYGTVADSRGEFVFPRLLKTGEVLMFSSIGLKTIEYVVPETAPETIAIAMPADTIIMVDEILVENTTLTPKTSRRLRKLMK